LTGNNAITSKQMMRFTFVCQTGIGVINLPALLAKEVGHDGWISVLATGIIAIFLSSLIVVLLRRFSDKCIYDITKLLFGRVAGFIINTLFFIYLIFTTSGGLMVFLVYLKITLFPLTPSIVMAPLIILPSIYMVWQGMKTVARFKMVTIFAYVIVIIYIILLVKKMRFSFLLPIGETGFATLLSSIRTSFFAFIGLELIAIFYPEISDKENALKSHVCANLFTMLFIIVVVLACTALFGENLLAVINIPLFNLSRVYHAPIIERVDLYLISAWFIAMGCSIRAYMMAAYYSMGKIFRMKKSFLIYVLFISVIIGLSLLIIDINKAFMFLDAINYGGIGAVILLMLCLILSMFRNNGVSDNG
jgi:spore germination protein (amino acid permease)